MSFRVPRTGEVEVVSMPKLLHKNKRKENFDEL